MMRFIVLASSFPFFLYLQHEKRINAFRLKKNGSQRERMALEALKLITILINLMYYRMKKVTADFMNYLARGIK
jgi:hypothetical protein